MLFWKAISPKKILCSETSEMSLLKQKEKKGQHNKVI